LPLAVLAPPCGVRALAIRALDKAGIAWTENFVGGGVTAVVAAALAGLAVVPLAGRIAPPGLVDIGPAEGLPRLASSKVMLHSKVSDPAKLMALRTLAATFRSVVGSAKRSVS
jgi:DNA-binding transcriptional LysR family regulator